MRPPEAIWTGIIINNIREITHFFSLHDSIQFTSQQSGWDLNSFLQIACLSQWTMKRVNRGYANLPIHYDLLTKSALPFSPWICNPGKNIWIRHKVFNFRAPKMDESANRCNCRIRKSVKILLWIRNPGKNIFKICRSICLFSPLVNAPAAQSYLLQALVYIKAGIKIHYIRYLSIWLWLFKSWIAQSTG